MKNVADIYPLTPAQAGMLFHTIAAPTSGVYFEQYTCTLRGALDVDAFRRAWQQTIDRHPVLRTAFIWEKIDKPLQVVREAADLPFALLDWQGMMEEEQEQRWITFLAADRRTGFNLAHAPITRVTLMRTTPDTHRMVWSFHHLISDGWSTPLILQELFAHYEAQRQGKSPTLPTRRPYRDYIAWQQKQDRSAAERFWRQELAGFTAPTVLPVKEVSTRSYAEHSDYGEQTLQLTQETSAALHALAQEQRLTLNTLVQGAWAILLSRYTGENDVVFGATASGRPAALHGVEEMIGMFINTLPNRVRLAADADLLPWFRELQTRQLDARQYEYSGLPDVQRWSELPAGTALFDTIVVFENYPLDGGSILPADSSLFLENVRYYEQSNFPLSLLVLPGVQLTLYLIHDRAHYDDATVQRILGHLHTLLREITADSERKIGDLTMLTAADRQQFITWNDTACDYPRERCIHHFIEEHAKATPTSVAVTFDDEELSYGELNGRAEQLAQDLQSLGVGPNIPVGLCLERSLEMIIAIVGVLKAGGCYLPLDPSYPAARLAFMLADAGAPVLITTHALRANFPELDVQSSGFRVQGPESQNNGLPHCIVQTTQYARQDNPQAKTCTERGRRIQNPNPEDLAYIIYTSGSTGKPKGVPISHRNLVHSTTARFSFYPEPVRAFLLLSSFAFDSSIVGIFWTLCQGGTLVLPRQREEQDVQRLVHLIARYCVTHTLCLPSLYRVILDYADAKQLATLNTVMVAGEACPPELVQHHYDRLPHATLYNEYGPTEGTVWATAGALRPHTPLTIGRPIPNMQAYILDAHRHPVPIGVPGELYIGGEGIARGYLNRPDLTRERFASIEDFRFLISDSDSLTNLSMIAGTNPKPVLSEVEISKIQNSKLYRTGDLARWLPNGEIDFLGRVDEQIKLRGHRIELGEIEAILLEHPAVTNAAAIVTGLSSEQEESPLRPDDIDQLVEYASRLSASELDDLLSEMEALSDVEAEVLQIQ